MVLLHPQELNTTLNALYHASFAEHKDIVSKDVLSEILATVHGESKSKEIMAKVATRIPESDATTGQGLRNVEYE